MSIDSQKNQNRKNRRQQKEEEKESAEEAKKGKHVKNPKKGNEIAIDKGDMTELIVDEESNTLRKFKNQGKKIMIKPTTNFFCRPLSVYIESQPWFNYFNNNVNQDHIINGFTFFVRILVSSWKICKEEVGKAEDEDIYFIPKSALKFSFGFFKKINCKIGLNELKQKYENAQYKDRSSVKDFELKENINLKEREYFKKPRVKRRLIKNLTFNTIASV